MKNKLYFLLIISLVLCNASIAQNCAVVELAKDFSRNSELKEILQESNHFKAWRILFSEKPALRTSTPEIKLVAENLTQIEKSGGYNRWIELLAAEEKNVPVPFLDSQKKFEEKVNVSKLPKHLKALAYQYYKKANNENKPHLWKRIEEIFTDYNINAKYPPYNGGYNIKDNVAISQYAKYDRYCNPIGKWDGTSEPILGGNFTSPIVNGKPFDFPSRALNLPQTDYKIYFEIEVLDAADLKGQLADVIPWFNQKGQGKQMMWYLPTDPNTNYPKTWNQLAQEGKIRITIKDVQSTDPNLLKWKGKVLGKVDELVKATDDAVKEGIEAVGKVFLKNIDDFKKAIERGENVFYVGKHNDITPRPTGVQSHHGVNSVWMREKYSNYGSGNSAPTVYMLNEPNHNATRGVFNKWVAEMKIKQGANRVDYSKVTKEEIMELANRQFDAANVPKEVRDEYFRLWNEYLETLIPNK